MTPFKCLMAIFIAVSWYASEFLYYLWPTLSFWLFWLSVACWIPVFLFLLGALFRLNWREIAVFSVAWALALLPIANLEPMGQFRFWLQLQGFRIHVASDEQYLSRCKMISFMENGTEQQLGECESKNRSIDFRNVVFYDSTGQFALPAKQRTQEWKDAMYYNFSPHSYLTDKAVARLSFGKFYAVVVPTDAEEGG